MRIVSKNTRFHEHVYQTLERLQLIRGSEHDFIHTSILAIIGMRYVHMEFDRILAQINGSSKKVVTDSRYTSSIFNAGQILSPNPKLNDSLSLGGSKNET